MTRDELIAFIADQVVNTEEAAELLGCTRQNIYDLIKRGKLEPIKSFKRDRIFLKSDIIERMESGGE